MSMKFCLVSNDGVLSAHDTLQEATEARAESQKAQVGVEFQIQEIDTKNLDLRFLKIDELTIDDPRIFEVEDWGVDFDRTIPSKPPLPAGVPPRTWVRW